MRIDWSAGAERDLRSLGDLVARDSPVYARYVVERIVETVERLAKFAELGRRVPEAADRADLREVVQTPYRIVYRTRPGGFTVITIVTGRPDVFHRAAPPQAMNWTSGGHRR